MNSQRIKRLPSWLSRKMGQPSALHAMKNILRSRNLHTVCESARCPNIGECFSKPTATFMILGDVCTRQCGFCSVEKTAFLSPLEEEGGVRGKTLSVDPDEPENIALTAKELGLKHVVITSVTRDDLADSGAMQFALTIKALRDIIPSISIEVLTPDFKGEDKGLKIVLDERPDIFNHNIETVPSLYAKVRPQADYRQSLKVIETAKKMTAGIITKSGLMVGLGETNGEIKSALKDLLNAGCDAVTIGQYLRPSIKNLEVQEYIPLDVFKKYEEYGRKIGLKYVYSGPFVRSSYNAEKFAG
ncbi:MAG TPA: lipoyl synthase [Thermodesulfobacteriota bacterium]|nr:lipoyl synthase [Thermodesulfobacteriota bacterium]